MQQAIFSDSRPLIILLKARKEGIACFIAINRKDVKLSNGYIVTEIKNNSVVLEDVTTTESKEMDIEELADFSKENIVVGYNTVTGKVKATIIDDFIKYRIAKAKLIGDECTIEQAIMNNSPVWVITVEPKVVDDKLIITVPDRDNIKTGGLIKILWDIDLFLYNSEMELVFDIPTDNYSRVYMSRKPTKGTRMLLTDFSLNSVSFTERCTFKGITYIYGLFKEFPSIKNGIDMSNLDFSSLSALVDFFHSSNIYDTRIKFPKIEGQTIVSCPFKDSLIGCDGLEFIDDLVNDCGLATLTGDPNYTVVLPKDERLIRATELLEKLSLKKDFPFKLDSLTIPVSKFLLENPTLLKLDNYAFMIPFKIELNEIYIEFDFRGSDVDFSDIPIPREYGNYLKFDYQLFVGKGHIQQKKEYKITDKLDKFIQDLLFANAVKQREYSFVVNIKTDVANINSAVLFYNSLLHNGGVNFMIHKVDIGDYIIKEIEVVDCEEDFRKYLENCYE